MGDKWLFFVLGTLVSLQIIYFVIYVRPFLRTQDPSKGQKPHKKPIYFVVAIKNEGHQLKEFLSQFRSVNDRSFKIVLVDDYSDELHVRLYEKIVADCSFAVLINSKQKPGKKHALSQFIQSTEVDDIILTDCDCRFSPQVLIDRYGSRLSNNDVVLGYGPFYKEKSILNKVLRFECAWIAAQYFGWSNIGNPYMAVGRNMAVKAKVHKEKFNRQSGLELISGDDDLFVQALDKENNIDISVDASTFSYSHAEGSYASYLRQKTRQITTSLHYKFTDQVILMLTSILSVLVWPGIIYGLLFQCSIPMICLFLIKLLFSYYSFARILSKLKESDLILFVPLWELFYGMNLVILGIYSLIRRQKIWK